MGMTLSPAKIAGRLGMNYVERVALNAGCKPIPMPEDLDTGIDGFIEFTGAVGTRLIAFQVKRGPSFFDGTGPRCQTDAKHLSYWKRYPLPVILIVVREDDSEAFWMDVTEHLRDRPSLVEVGPFTLHPPKSQRFDAAALGDVIGRSASPSDFGDAASALADVVPEVRRSGLSLLYRFRMERRAPLCLAAALRAEPDLGTLAMFCDFYSRYMPHPEFSFGARGELHSYAIALLAGLPRTQLLRVLAAFHDDEEHGDWSGATEIFNMAPEQIWDRYDVIHRGTVQQSIAEVVRHAASPEDLFGLLADCNVPISERRSAAALFGYLGYSAPVEHLNTIAASEPDRALRALLHWLRHWIDVELEQGGSA